MKKEEPRKEDKREKLLCSAMQVFADQGYVGASTRDICREADSGNAAIHYHFGDKAAIYRELFERLLSDFEQRMRAAQVCELCGREGLLAYYRALMRPLAEDPSLAKQIYLHLREEFQPSGVVDDFNGRALRLQFDVLGAWLQRELGLRKPDAAMQRLVLALHGMSLSFVVMRRSIDSVMPGLMEGQNWFNRLTSQLADMGWGMVEAERARRACAARKEG